MDYYIFNAIEATFWIIFGVVGYTLRNVKGKKYKKLAVYILVVMITFGLSDIAEILYGSFLEADLIWLLIWKAVNIIAIIYAMAWYMSLRIRKEVMT